MTVDHINGLDTPPQRARRALEEAEARHQIAEETMQAAAVMFADALIDHPHDHSLASWHRLQYTNAKALLRAALDDVEDAYERWSDVRLQAG